MNRVPANASGRRKNAAPFSEAHPAGPPLSPSPPTAWGGLVVLCIPAALASYFVPILAVIPALVGLLLALVGVVLILGGNLWFLLAAFQDEVIMGVACLFVPFFSLYYLITHFDQVKTPFFVSLIGVGLVMLGRFLGGLSQGLAARPPAPPVRGQILWPAASAIADFGGLQPYA